MVIKATHWIEIFSPFFGARLNLHKKAQANFQIVIFVLLLQAVSSGLKNIYDLVLITIETLINMRRIRI
jgi:hypothetical protein